MKILMINIIQVLYIQKEMKQIKCLEKYLIQVRIHNINIKKKIKLN
jgi:hypothetical protein